MTNSEEYEKLINGLSDPNFNELVRAYAKDYYKTDELHISNGPYDGGIDLTIFRNSERIKKNIQITVTKTKSKIEKKIFEDVEKSAINVKEYGYLKKLDFYISASLTNSTQDKFIRKAELEYDIDLKIIDARKLAGNMDEFPVIKKTLQLIYNFDESDSEFKISKKDKILFNVIASGEDSSKIKRHLLHAYILSALFETPEMDVEDLYKALEQTITITLDRDGVFQEVNYLKSKNILKGSAYFELTDEWQEKLSSILELNNLQEKDLTVKLNSLLKEKGIADKSPEISRKLIDLYVQHFQLEIDEISKTDNSFLISTRKIFEEIISLLKSFGITNDSDCDDLAKQIIEVSSSNEFLTKIGASSMYVKLYNSDKLEDFINKTSRSICLDTQVLLRLLCVLYNPNSSDYSLKAVNNLHKIIQESDLLLDVFTMEGYVIEVAAHLKKALKIYNYLRLPLFEKVGKTRNVFYNYYNELIHKGLLEKMDFRKFVEEELLGVGVPDEFDKEFVNRVSRRLIKLFQQLDFEVYTPNYYDSFPKVKRDFEIELSHKEHVRSRQAIFHDVKTSLFMSDEENHFDIEEEIYLEPYFVTWDYQFYNLREIAKKHFNEYKHWFVYTPHKFIEKLQLGKFKINPESINETILSIVESNFNTNNSNKTFLDVIAAIFNKENVGELKLAQKFANIEEAYLNEKEEKDSFNKVVISESPLTSILSILISHYNDPESDNSMEDFTLLCQDDEKADNLVNIINDAIGLLNLNKFDKDDVIKKINDLISN